MCHWFTQEQRISSKPYQFDQSKSQPPPSLHLLHLRTTRNLPPFLCKRKYLPLRFSGPADPEGRGLPAVFFWLPLMRLQVRRSVPGSHWSNTRCFCTRLACYLLPPQFYLHFLQCKLQDIKHVNGFKHTLCLTAALQTSAQHLLGHLTIQTNHLTHRDSLKDQEENKSHTSSLQMLFHLRLFLQATIFTSTQWINDSQDYQFLCIKILC